MSSARDRPRINGEAAWLYSWVIAKVNVALWRRRASLAALLLYVILTLAMLTPLASDTLPDSPAQDLANHVSGIIEARNALAEGQFPIRVAPNQNNAERYPIFQFYGNLPYLAGGLLYIATDINPYLVWKIIVAASLVIGAFFTNRCAAKLTRRAVPAIVSGAVFITAPYFLTDIFGRFAYPEIVSFGLLPVVFYYVLRCFMSRKLVNIPLSAIAWSCLGLAHNITYLYASIFFSLYFLSFAAWNTTYIWRMVRVGVAYGAGVLLTVWYFVPQLISLPYIGIGAISGASVLYSTEWLTPLRVLLAPSLVVPTPPPPAVLDNPYFGLQIGWPILLAVGLASYCLFRPARFIRYSYVALVRLLIFFGLAFFVVWTPFDFWRYLPNILSYVQFSYRILMFVVLWGSLLAAYGLTYAFRYRMRSWHVIVVAVVLVIYVQPYLAPHPPSKYVSVASEIKAPNMGRGGATSAYSMSASALMATSLLPKGINMADWDYNIISPAWQLHYPGTGQIPAPKTGDSLTIAGFVPDQHNEPITLTVSIDATIIKTISLGTTGFRFTLPIDTSFPGERAEIMLRTDRYLDPASLTPAPAVPGNLGLGITELTLKPLDSHSSGDAIIVADEARKTQLTDNLSSYMIHNKQARLVQLPVLFYPNMIQVQDNGHVIDYKNLGRFIVLQLSEGDHAIRAQFNGVSWANTISLLAWLAVLGIYIFLVTKQLIRI